MLRKAATPAARRYDGNYLDAPFPRPAPAGRFQNFSPAPLAPIFLVDVVPTRRLSQPLYRDQSFLAPYGRLRPFLLVLVMRASRATVPALRQRITELLRSGFVVLVEV